MHGIGLQGLLAALRDYSILSIDLNRESCDFHSRHNPTIKTPVMKNP